MMKGFQVKATAAFVFAAATLLLTTLGATPAHAQPGGGISLDILGIDIGISFRTCTNVGYGLTGLGDVLCNIGQSLSDIPGLFTAFAYLCGVYLAISGIIKIREHVTNPQQTQIWDPMKRFLAGGAFFALPAVLNAVRTTIRGDEGLGGATPLQSYDMAMFAGSTGGDLSLGPFSIDLPFIQGGGLDTMLVALIGDIWAPMLGLIGGFGYLAGIVLVMVGISRLLKTAQDGPRGPGGIGTIMTFLTAGALFSLDALMGAFQVSLFDNVKTANYAIVGTLTGSANADDHVTAVISAILGFMVIVGWISFVRGLFIFRDVAEGSQQASIMAAFTHLIGGAVAVNLGALLNAVQSTFGLLPYGVKFLPIG
jgi:hypothetical protein